ncbi:MAG: ATP-binding protein [Mycobacteriales bacterium]
MTQRAERPAPTGIADAAEFIARLNQLRVWAGRPALRRLTALAGTTIAPDGYPVPRLPASTVSDMLTGKRLPRLPRLDLIEAYVAACLTVRDVPAGEIARELAGWGEAWRALAVTEDEVAAPAAGSTPAVPAPPVPRQLPPDLANFVGRHDALKELDELAAAAGGVALAVTVIVGPAGVGKTALAVRWAHRVADRFPDGQLHLDLRGHGPDRPVPATTALARLLHALGVPPGQVPVDLDEQSALYRSLMAGRRMLVLLDNAASAEQVRPLLPGGPDCQVVVTSRGWLSSVDGASHLRLDVLSEQEAVALLGRLAGPDRAAAEPDEASTIVRLSGLLPLAVRIAGARLASRPDWSLATLAGRLADERRRLDELQLDDLGMRASFAVSDEGLRTSPDGQRAARLFRLLGLLDGPDVGLSTAAAVAGLPPGEAGQSVDRLVDAQLLTPTGADRYRMHDLIRLYAREQAVREESIEDRQAALVRVLRCQLRAAASATRLLYPDEARRIPAGFEPGPGDPRTRAEAIEWVEAERANLVALMRQAATLPGEGPALAVQLAAALYRPMDIRGYFRERLAINQLAVRITRDTGDRAGEAQALEDLATVYGQLGRLDEAIDCNERALAAFRDLGDRRGEAACLVGTGINYRQRGCFETAAEYLERGLRLSREDGHRPGEASALNNLGQVAQRQGRHAAAVDWHRQAIAVYRELGNRLGEAMALVNLGWAHHRAGQQDHAVVHLESGAALFRELGDRYNEAEGLWALGACHHAAGRDDQARAFWRRSLALLQDIGVLSVEEATTLHTQPVPDTPRIIQLNT